MEANTQQIQDAVRWIVSVFGGMVAGWFAARGWVTTEQIMSFLNSGTFIGLATTAATFVLGWISRRQTNQVANVRSMDEVAGIVTQPTQAGVALANSVPGSDVAPAGTSAAAAIAAK